MSDKNDFGFSGISEDAELEALLESVRRDLGEASPAGREKEPPARTYNPRETAGGEAAPSAGTPSADAEPARQARQLRQPRPQAPKQRPAAREAAPVATAERRPARERRSEPQADFPPQRERIKVVHPEDEDSGRKSRFGLALLIYALVLALALGAACAVLWFYLDAYESTRPEGVMEEFTRLADEDYWSEALSGSFTVGETPFEDRDELMDELCLGVLRANELEYREDEGYSETNMTYMVSAGGKDVCRVTLEPLAENGDAGFGFTYLGITRVELLASFTAPEAYEITITAPAGSVVGINGVTVGSEYMAADEAVNVTDLGELEQGMASELYSVYRVGGLYAPVEVYCGDAEGNAYPAAGEPEDGSVTFALGEGTLDYRVLVPAGSSVTVNGVELSGDYNTGDTATPAFLDGFESYGAVPEFELWRIEGLHAAPEVIVTTSGGETLDEPVVDGGELTFFASGDQATEDAHSSEAAAFMNAYINYLTGAASGAEDYTALQALVLDGSALDTALAGLNADYAADGRTAEHVYIRYGSFVPVGSTCYVCSFDVEFAPEEEGGEGTAETYTLVSVMYGGVWYAAAVTC